MPLSTGIATLVTCVGTVPAAPSRLSELEQQLHPFSESGTSLWHTSGYALTVLVVLDQRVLDPVVHHRTSQ
ncbi:hypothetical protein [Streptomyces sp. NPDC055287]